jgi:hypothetical protein
MKECRLAGAFGAVIALFAARTAVAVDDPMGYRVFLKDGTSLVSDGEPAPREHGVAFSIPTWAFVNDRQRQLVTCADYVDWD